MILAAALLGAILLVIGCGGIFLYRVLVEAASGRLPDPPISVSGGRQSAYSRAL